MFEYLTQHCRHRRQGLTVAIWHRRLRANVSSVRHSPDTLPEVSDIQSRLYVADFRKCVWRVSSDGKDRWRWLSKSSSDKLQCWAMSVTSTHLLVTTRNPHQLLQFDSDGDELRRVQLPNYKNLYHAVESPTGTFVVSLCNTQLRQHQVVEVNTGGEVQRQFSGSPLLSLGWTPHVAVDSHGSILVADASNRHILLLDAHLSLRRVIIDEHQLNYEQPWRLCYREQSGQLLVGLYFDIVAFDVLCC